LNDVTSISACVEQAKAKGYNVSGSQNFGECWAGTNADWDRMGMATCCEDLGGTCTQHIYVAPPPPKPVPPPPPPPPALPPPPTVPKNKPGEECINNMFFKKIGTYNLGLTLDRPDNNAGRPEFAKGKWIWISNDGKNDWSKAGSKNESYAAITVQQHDNNGVDVMAITKQVGKENGINSAYQPDTVKTINYLIKHKTKDSYVVIRNCGFLDYGYYPLGQLNGALRGNPPFEGPYSGKPLIGEEYDFYYNINKQEC
jgi:hypothetical protein